MTCSTGVLWDLCLGSVSLSSLCLASLLSLHVQLLKFFPVAGEHGCFHSVQVFLAGVFALPLTGGWQVLPAPGVAAPGASEGKGSA